MDGVGSSLFLHNLIFLYFFQNAFFFPFIFHNDWRRGDSVRRAMDAVSGFLFLSIIFFTVLFI